MHIISFMRGGFLKTRSPSIPIRLLLVSALLFFQFACASQQPIRESSSQTTFSKADLKEIPRFYLDPPQMENVLFGLGQGRTLKEATAAAQTDIASQLESRITAEIKTQYKQEGNKGSEKVEITSQQRTDILLKKVKRLDHKVTTHGYYYSLCFLPLEMQSGTEQIEQSIRKQIEEQEHAFKVKTTLFSSLLPGTGQIMNRNYTKGIFLLSTGVALIGTASVFFISTAIDYQQSVNARNTSLRDYYYQRAFTKGIIGLISSILYIGEAIYSGIDNYSSF